MEISNVTNIESLSAHTLGWLCHGDLGCAIDPPLILFVQGIATGSLTGFISD